MTGPDLLVTEPGGPAVGTLLFAHGAGGPMDSDAMNRFAAAAAAVGVRVVRFEFPYMAARRTGARKPPPKAETLVPAFRDALAAARERFDGPLVIGGKSLGGRVAVMAAADLGRGVERPPVAVFVFGYPFHPPQKPEATRLAPLEAARLPVVIGQGTRDPFGTREEVGGYALPASVAIHWMEDGDHDLRPRRASGFAWADHLASAAAIVRSLLA